VGVGVQRDVGEPNSRPRRKSCAASRAPSPPAAGGPLAQARQLGLARWSGGSQPAMKRATATYGSWLYCSKNSHCSACARCQASAGNSEPAFGEVSTAIAFDSGSGGHRRVPAGAPCRSGLQRQELRRARLPGRLVHFHPAISRCPVAPARADL
jgi:hypothetical protein